MRRLLLEARVEGGMKLFPAREENNSFPIGGGGSEFSEVEVTSVIPRLPEGAGKSGTRRWRRSRQAGACIPGFRVFRGPGERPSARPPARNHLVTSRCI